MFRANNFVGTGGSDSTANLVSSVQGNHGHGQPQKGGTGSGNQGFNRHAAKGGHSHAAIGVEVTNSLRRYALSAWRNASAAFDLTSGMVGMYESLTPPDGWALCDGNNGTPDLRNYFIRPVTTGSEGASGDGTLTATSADSMDHASHNHDVGTASSFSGYATHYHANDVTMDSHTLSDNYTWLPPYYALAFIIKVDE